jgi:BirA family biotin operon repressor/biotin-[acetyl-CoA-carboxylase] ligase
MLNAEKIKNLIHSKYPAACVRVFDTTDSTNTRAKEDKTLSLGMICARAQTAGRGRQGHSFYSPADTGLYMTAVLPITPMQAYEFSLTAAAAVACVRAIGRVCKKTPLIKWVNDLYMGGKKIAGILTEADSDRVIVGIGINVTTDIFPHELPLAGSVGIDADLSELAAAVFLELADMALRGDRSFMSEYRSLSMLLGKRLSYMQNGTLTQAEAVAIDDMGRLEVRLCSGETAMLSSGEVSIVM